MDPERYLDFIRRASEAVDIPLIASLNGVTDHGWISYARRIEEAGARAIELNIYFIPSDLALTGQEVERLYLDIVRAVRASVRIPIAVKIGPYFSAPGHMARRLDQEGADGLVLFNRFYQPDIDLAKLALVSDLELSNPYEIRLPLLWMSLLSGRVKASLAASTGVESADEVVKYLLAGADVVMTTSSLLRHGVGHMKALLDGLKAWLGARGLRIGERRPRPHEPAERRRPGRLRARQLYQDAAILPRRSVRGLPLRGFHSPIATRHRWPRRPSL